METETSEIRSFFASKKVFVTGGSGFLGKLLVEKLLRECPDVQRIYLLLRDKKGKTAQERFDELFAIPAFEPLRKLNPEFTQKLTIIKGDLLKEDLGMSDEDVKVLKREVNVVFHCGATVRFDEHIKRAAYINVRATRDLMTICKDMSELQSFVHVSTAYSNCTRQSLKEQTYDQQIPWGSLLSVIENLDDETLARITDGLLKDIPNTYVLTKGVAEKAVEDLKGDLPASIVRPSIIVSTYKQPIPGWTDNFYGASGIFVAVGLGLLRSIYGNGDNVADMIPADFVVNNLVAVAWDTYRRKLEGDRKIKVFNITSGRRNPITWNEYQKNLEEEGQHFPSPYMQWHYWFKIRSVYFMHWLVSFFTQTVPAHIVDFFMVVTLKEPFLVKGYKKIDKFSNVTSWFVLRQWDFDDGNVVKLSKGLNRLDGELFRFDIATMRWKDFFHDYIYGTRVYLLKDPMETLPEGKRKQRIFFYLHYAIVALYYYLVYRFVSFLYVYLFK